MATIPLMPMVRPVVRPSAVGLCLVGLVAFAFLVRWPSFGNPTYKLDEQFYLLVGDRLLHGALPYVDIWDRKPIGLFLIYAAVRLLGGDGVVQYQVIATFFAGATAGCVFLLARKAAGLPGALVGGILYLLWIEVAEGGGGQSPVFYNLPMAAAALLTFEATSCSDHAAFRKRAFGAMALVGLAIQIKYTAVCEGLFFGIVVAWQAWARAGYHVSSLGEIALLALTALAPTLLAFGIYAVLHQGRTFYFANFSSIFLRGDTDRGDLLFRLRMSLLRIVPLVLCAAAGFWHLRQVRSAERTWQLFVIGWIAAALAGFLCVGVLYSHYLLPMFVPLCVAATPILRRWPTGAALGALALVLPASVLHYPYLEETRNGQRQLATLAALVPAAVRTGCMQMFAGPPSLYQVTGACTRTPYIFPDHLTLTMERDAIGVDQHAELDRTLASRPEVITYAQGGDGAALLNPASVRMIEQVLGHAYREAGHAIVDGQKIGVYVRR